MPTYTITQLLPLNPADGSLANEINDQGSAAGSCLWEGTTPHALPSPQEGGGRRGPAPFHCHVTAQSNSGDISPFTWTLLELKGKILDVC